MAQQKLIAEQFGAADQRVLDMLTPLNGEAAPAVNAKFIGQLFVDTVAGVVYISKATDSDPATGDWVALADTSHTHA